MGYSAFVPCNCYKEKKTSTPPHNLRLIIDSEGYYCIDEDKVNHLSQQEIQNLNYEIEEWAENACEHDRMRLCDEWLGNGFFFAEFRQQIYKLSSQYHLPILTEFLPISNGSNLPAKFAKQALAELQLLENIPKIFCFYLIEKTTHQEIFDNFYVIHKSHTLRIKQTGLTIERFRDAENSTIIFQSTHFTQQKIADDEFEFVDIATQQKVTCPVYIVDFKNYAIGKIFEFTLVLEEIDFHTKFKVILERLKNLCQASVLSGNAIYWH